MTEQSHFSTTVTVFTNYQSDFFLQSIWDRDGILNGILHFPEFVVV